MDTIGSLENMMSVATNCHGYTPTESGLTSAVGSENCKSCNNCKNLSNNVCQVDLYDEVLSSMSY